MTNPPSSSQPPTLQQIQQTFRDYKPKPLGITKRYAVLMPLIDTPSGLSLLYEVRAHGISQSGDAAFPGGQVEDGESFQAAALRETEEELGISRDQIELMGKMDMLVRHDRWIQCFVGYLGKHTPSDFTTNPNEVDHLFTLPVAKLLTLRPEWHTLKAEIQVDDDFPYDRIPNGRHYHFFPQVSSVPFYPIKKEHLWGMTAELTARWCELLRNEGEYYEK
ncbi:MAG: CoA pyrophosphatase [Aerococcus sp.]|nr:CoA pyrophosphatase [Aerococcus sp.]